MKYNFIELCSGAGGLSTGLIKVGLEPVLLNDNNKDCCNTLKKNHPETKVINSSMTDIDFTQYINKIDLLCGGVPCQSFSSIGKRKGLEDKRGDLILRFVDVIFTIKPKIFLIENVKGLLNHNDGDTLKYILDYIEDKSINENIKYTVKYQILNSYDFEVPQKRERLIIIGSLEYISVNYPLKSDRHIVLKDVLVNVPESKGILYNDRKIALYKHIPQGGCWINLPEELQKEYLGKSFYSGEGKRGILHRLSMDKPSLTLLTSPSQKQTERCHPLETRPLKIREYARIQTFPDEYEFVGSVNSVYKQIGNAVPVNMSYHIGLELIKSLNECSYEIIFVE